MLSLILLPFAAGGAFFVRSEVFLTYLDIQSGSHQTTQKIPDHPVIKTEITFSSRCVYVYRFCADFPAAKDSPRSWEKFVPLEANSTSGEASEFSSEIRPLDNGRGFCIQSYEKLCNDPSHSERYSVRAYPSVNTSPERALRPTRNRVNVPFPSYTPTTFRGDPAVISIDHTYPESYKTTLATYHHGYIYVISVVYSREHKPRYWDSFLKSVQFIG